MVFFVFLQGLLFLYLLFILFTYVKYHKEFLPKLSTLGWKPVDEGVLIIVPAKDEQEGIGNCIKGLSALNGLNKFQIIPVDDRSADQTLNKMKEAGAEPVHIDHLPEGWLGKNHACWMGVQKGLERMPDAEYLLFTDGDVRFHPDVVAESITWMKKNKTDFMTLIEDPEFEGILEPAYLLLFGIFLIFFSARPWLLQKPKGKNFMGNGAYLLIRRDAYEKTQGHKSLRLEVVEDMRMGLMMRSQGYRCATAVGMGRIKRRWQPGFTAVFKGLIKNAFAGFEYNVPFTLIGLIFFPFVFLGPWLCLFTPYAFVGVGNLILLLLCFYFGSQDSALPWPVGFLLSPFLALVASANLATSAFVTLKQGGVRWRNTTYPLSELKAHCLTMRRAFQYRR